MSMLRICSEPGCGTRTLGPYCMAHESAFARLEMSPSTQRLRRKQPRQSSATPPVDVRTGEGLRLLERVS
jgi:hypothetical protein